MAELQRTCDRCQTAWYVTPAETKKPKKFRWIGNPAGLKMQSAVGGKQRAGAELRLSRYASEGEGYERARRCPNCGSGQFTEASA